jgi:hypothetical protein
MSTQNFFLIIVSIVCFSVTSFVVVFAQETVSPTITVPTYEAPAFFSPSMTQEEIDVLTPEQKQELGMYLSRRALVAPGVLMEISSVEAIIDAITYTTGDIATIDIAWISPIVTPSLSPDGDTSGLPSLLFELTFMDKNGVLCADTLKSSVLVSNTHPSFSMPIVNDCVRPQIGVSITDWNGVSLGSWNIEQPHVRQSSEDGWVTIVVVFLILVALIVLGIASRRFNGACPSFSHLLKRE